ncbi:MAG: polysaccharide deacetylase family protein [Lachnospiraceae bacterium]|nr:polysaccharide deacetylase family protein [Lachnospiraceae bacterium]
MKEKIRVVVLVVALCLAGSAWMKHDDSKRISQYESETKKESQMLTQASAQIDGEAAVASKDIKKVAITFDDGPDPIWTEKLLDGLAERNVHATFFVLGKKVAENEALLKRMQEEGHLIGNHSYNHVQLNRLREAVVKKELDDTNEQVYEATGYRPEYVRPPYGAWDKKKDCPGEMMTVYWTIDTMDWQLLDADKVMKNVVGKVSDGDIILLHDVYESSVDAALKIVDYLQEEGYELVTVDQLILE